MVDAFFSRKKSENERCSDYSVPAENTNKEKSKLSESDENDSATLEVQT